MERQECLKLELFKDTLSDNCFTVLGVVEDRVSYGVIVKDTIVSPYMLSALMNHSFVGVEMIKHEGFERLCFYILKD